MLVYAWAVGQFWDNWKKQKSFRSRVGCARRRDFPRSYELLRKLQ